MIRVQANVALFDALISRSEHFSRTRENAVPKNAKAEVTTQVLQRLYTNDQQPVNASALYGTRRFLHTSTTLARVLFPRQSFR